MQIITQLSLLTLCGCQPPGDEQQGGLLVDVQGVYRLFDNMKIPVLPDGEQQLSYAGSDFLDPAEKRAALQAVIELHPADHHATGMARLELAYLALGPDYRLAEKSDILQAATLFRALLDNFPDDRLVTAKCLWYLGWLHCDLLGSPDAGLQFYRRLRSGYRDVGIELRPAPPWQNLDHPQQRAEDGKLPEGSSVQASAPKAGPQTNSPLSWADLAGLELIRYSKEQEESATILRELAAASPKVSPRLYHKALLLFLQRFAPDPDMVRLAASLIQRELDKNGETLSPTARADLLAALAALTLDKPPTTGSSASNHPHQETQTR